MINLREQGFRFVKRLDEFKWVHPAMLEPSDTDCTDMTDDEFEQFVMLTERSSHRAKWLK